ncbi:MAG: RDD family protein [Bacteroidota bacterium]
MNKFSIQTAQNVKIQQQVAHLTDRVFAILIDLLIMGAYLFLVIFLLSKLNIPSATFNTMFSVLLLPVLFYHLLFELLNNGQSIGKKALRIRVVKLDGSKPALSNYLIRWLLRIIDITLTSGAIAIVAHAFSKNGQRIGDMAAGTTLISVREKNKYNQIVSVFKDLPDDYQPKYTEVRIFTDDDMQKINRIFADAFEKNRHKIIIKLSNQLAEQMKVNFDETPQQFVRQVITDYHYFTAQ